MLTRMRFKNWRSLKDVEINDLTPITVFIGANSSGKTNIIDGLSFLRRMLRENKPDSTYFQANQDPIRTIGSPSEEGVELEITYKSERPSLHPTYQLSIETVGKQPYFHEKISTVGTPEYFMSYDGMMIYWGNYNGEPLLSMEGVDGSLVLPQIGISETKPRWFTPEHLHNPYFDLYTFVTSKWQILGEGFNPALRFFHGQQMALDTYTIGPNAQDLPMILAFMQEKSPEVYSELQEDLKWFMKHVSGFDVRQEAAETRVVLQERDFDAPTVSAGTSRALAMFTAYHALSMRYRELPGLIVIEEPDTALNPGLLQRFVEQLRVYTGGSHPRQFILTTHNPTFLNYFKPEEVRVVSRDEEGYTHVARIPDHIKDIWLDKYGLGEVWTTNSFEGLAE